MEVLTLPERCLQDICVQFHRRVGDDVDKRKPTWKAPQIQPLDQGKEGVVTTNHAVPHALMLPAIPRIA